MSFEFASSFEISLGDIGDDGSFAFGEGEGFTEALSLECFFDEARDFGDLRGTDDEVDVGVSLADIVGTDLGHASGYANDHFWSVLFDESDFSKE